MKTILILLILILCLCSINGLYAQPGSLGGPVVPYQLNGSPLFGKDITVFDRPTHDQRLVSMCSAFNGWLYVAQSSDSSGITFIEILKSTDNGLTWNRIVDEPAQTYVVTSMSLVVLGNAVSDLKLFLGVVFFNSYLDYRWGSVGRYNGINGGYEAQLLTDYPPAFNIDLALDYPYPANNSNPSSLAVLYSTNKKWSSIDSIIFRSSNNGGVSLNNRQVVAITPKYFSKVSLSYGYCSSLNHGLYYAAWEEKDSDSATLGHIYTAHTTPNFNSSLTTPIKLDDIDPTASNRCRNPVISCQVSNADNDSANITEVVLFEKKKPVGEDYDITGYYNLQSATTSHFRPLDIAVTSHNELQPDINFNLFDSTFMLTYYDSTDQKLPFLVKNFNIVNPNSWNVVSSGYNDASTLSAPLPKVQVSYGQNKGANVWTKELGGGIGASMFDAPYSTYTGIQDDNKGNHEISCRAFPNPCNQSITFDFTINRAQKVTIKLFNLLGQESGVISARVLPTGQQQLKADVSRFNPGSYIYTLMAEDYSYSGKLWIIR